MKCVSCTLLIPIRRGTIKWYSYLAYVFVSLNCLKVLEWCHKRWENRVTRVNGYWYPVVYRVASFDTLYTKDRMTCPEHPRLLEPACLYARAFFSVNLFYWRVFILAFLTFSIIPKISLSQKSVHFKLFWPQNWLVMSLL